MVRVTVRTVDGSEFEVATIATPDALRVDSERYLGVDSERYEESRFYVVPIQVDPKEIDTVRGYDARGQEVGR